MIKNQDKKLYVPALIIVVIILILLVFIGISTYRNLDSNRRHAMNFVYRQGIIMSNIIETSIRTRIMSPVWQEYSIGQMIVESGKNPEIDYIYLADSNSIIQYHSNWRLNGTRARQFPELKNGSKAKGHLKTLSDNTLVYEVVKKLELLQPENRILVIGMKMTAFDAAKDADIHHAYVMVAILVSLGAGTFFFIFVIRSYYLVNTILKQNQNYTHQVIASMANGLLSIDSKGEIITCNRLASELLGLDAVKITGMEISKVMDIQLNGISEVIKNCSSVIDREILHMCPDGREIPLALSVTPIPDDKERCSGMVVIIRDLREIKQLEEKVRKTEKLAALGKLAASVAHEIRNPLSSIRGFAQFLSHILKHSPENQEYAEIMVKEVDRINQVITDLLTFAKPVNLKIVPSDISEIIEHTVRLMEPDSRSAGVNIYKNIAQKPGEISSDTIYIDSSQITQVLLNLVLNAMHELEPGGIIEIGAAQAESFESGESGEFYLLWVEDNGPGIPSEYLGKIFDPFYTTREKGTGLGLAIVQKIVESHNGEILVQSPPHGKIKGCRFIIRIPIKNKA